MAERGQQLHTTADAQIAELIAVTSRLDEATLRLPCPGREKLGDGTVAACVQHTADNYQKIAGFVQSSNRISGEHEPIHNGGHRLPRLLRVLAHRRATHNQHGPSTRHRDDQYTADHTDLGAVASQLSASHDSLGRIAELTDSQLDAIPPKDSFRFCDGQRSLEQVLAGLLKHQSHQIEVLKTALD